MADAADDALPPAPRKTGAALRALLNGGGIFVLTLGAVVAGGFINVMLHPLPALQLGKDGKITAIVPVAPPSHGNPSGVGTPLPAFYYAIDPPLVVNFEDGSAVRFLQISMEVMAHDQKTI
jgi:flagellar basal body-associated protein FliL